MDEPFSALDPFIRQNMRQELLKIWEKEKTTVVFITHSIPEAVYLADRIILLKNGKIELNESIKIPRERDMNDPRFVEYVNKFESMLADGQTAHNDKMVVTND